MRKQKAPVAVVATRGPGDVDQPAGTITSNNRSKPKRTQRRTRSGALIQREHGFDAGTAESAAAHALLVQKGGASCRKG
jgi:hypothetical protein